MTSADCKHCSACGALCYRVHLNAGECVACSRKTIWDLKARLRQLEPVLESAVALLVGNGPCDDIEEDSEDYHCGDRGCHYCNLNRIASAVDDQPGEVE